MLSALKHHSSSRMTPTPWSLKSWKLPIHYFREQSLMKVKHKQSLSGFEERDTLVKTFRG